MNDSLVITLGAILLSSIISGLFRVFTAWLIYKRWKTDEYEVFSEPSKEDTCKRNKIN